MQCGSPQRQNTLWALLLLCLTFFATFTTAHSQSRNPLAALSTVQNATIHTHKHRLTALSKFDLTFILGASDDVHVKFHLEPNPDILGDDSRITYLSSDGTVKRRERLDRLAHRVYKGSSWMRYGENGKWRRTGWARCLVSREGKNPIFEGSFSVEGDHHHIQTSHNYARTRHAMDPEVEVAASRDEEYLVMWRNSDILGDEELYGHEELKRREAEDDDGAPICASDELSFNAIPENPMNRMLRRRQDKNWGVMDFSNLLGLGKRQIDGGDGASAGVNLIDNIGNAQGCPDTKKVALVGVATDCNYYNDFNKNETGVRENVISQMNTASGIWESTFNISLGLGDMTIIDEDCPGTPAEATEWNQACSDSVEIQDRLNMFSRWRGTLDDTFSHWTLLSTCGTGSAVGLAWMSQACVHGTNDNNVSTGNGASGVETTSGANVVIRTSGANEWQIIAHETGHTYGAVHDCTSRTCSQSNVVSAQQCCPLSENTCPAGEAYIMNPSTSSGVDSFSPCSVGNICAGIGRNSIDISCLSDNRNVDIITGQQCGNGIVEEGEECDCGGTQGCDDNSCCNPETCEFASGAVCDDANEDCCRNCQFASNGTVCRESTGECDPEETCRGDTSSCPEDVTAPDGNDCGDGLQCASGQCTSRDLQCKSIMGTMYTSGNDTYACDSSDCRLSCASPEFGPNTCYNLQQNFLDGTSCNGGGTCDNGRCTGASVGDEISSWIDDNKAIVIGVCSGVGALILFAILGCCCRRCRRNRHNQKVQQIHSSPAPTSWTGWRNDPRPGQGYYASQSGQGMSQFNGHPNHGWGGGGGGGWGSSPPVPPPAYAPRAGGGGGVRYA
ncbi:hypothetical protein MBLNU230_g0657t1 [Neophaeotheca triangularis]